MILWVLRSVRYCILLTKLYKTFYLEKVFALPPECHSPLPLCPKLPVLAAILRQQQVPKMIKNVYNNHNNTILYTDILRLVDPRQQFQMLFIIDKQAGSLFISILNNNNFENAFRCSPI